MGQLFSHARHDHRHHILDISDARKENLKIVVIGDVHGCFDELQMLLEKCGFKENNPDEWLAIFVGDIINKGPKNMEVLRYIMSLNNALCVKGNHEHNVVNKGGFKTANEKGTRELATEQVAFLQNLPLTIRIPVFQCMIVHAGIVPGVKLEEQVDNDMMNMRNIKKDENGKCIALQRPTEGLHWADAWNTYVKENSSDINSLSHTYPLIIYGHDAKRKLQKKPHSIGLDSGCLYGGDLTGYLLHVNKIISTPALKAYVEKNED